MEANTIICGDALDVLRTLPDRSVQTCVTSPPYFGLRSYLPDGHEDKPLEIGLEETPAQYIEKLVAVFMEVWRVLRDDGLLWVNIGDSYAGSGKGFGSKDHGKPGTHAVDFLPGKDTSGIKPKNLMGIPWRLAFALQDQGWILRSDIIWNKPTAMPESVTDRPTKSHEYIFMFAKSERYYYDADAIREPLKEKTFTTFGTKHRAQGNDALGLVKSDNWGCSIVERKPKLTADGEIAGANKRSVWTVASQPFKEAHFATFPPKLIEPCILAGSSDRCCEHCGTPWQRVIVPSGHINKREIAHCPFSNSTKTDSTGWSPARKATNDWRPGCTCPDNTGAGKSVVLDPFSGAGTTALVANNLNRRYIGIELNPEYVEMSRRRLVQPSLDFEWTA